MEILIAAVILYVAYMFITMVKKNKNPNNQICAEEIIDYICSDEMQHDRDHKENIISIVKKFDFENLDYSHVYSLVDIKLRQRGLHNPKIAELIKCIYMNEY